MKGAAAANEYKCTGKHAQLVTQFPDQFGHWDFGGMDVRKTMHSTLIRLPLRTLSMAESSTLSKVAPYIQGCPDSQSEHTGTLLPDVGCVMARPCQPAMLSLDLGLFTAEALQRT